MQFSWMALIILVLALACISTAAFVLWRPNWVMAWIKGSTGLALLGCAIFLLLLAANFYSYSALGEEAVATISFSRQQSQSYVATLVESNGRETQYNLDGDLWQIDAKIIKWKGFLAALGLTPGYKLDRIQGRYLSIEQERKQPRTVYGLSSPGIGFDLWEAARKNVFWLPWIDTSYGSATYVPMADGAIYAINLSASGFIARPLNPSAEKAILMWR